MHFRFTRITSTSVGWLLLVRSHGGECKHSQRAILVIWPLLLPFGYEYSPIRVYHPNTRVDTKQASGI